MILRNGIFACNARCEVLLCKTRLFYCALKAHVLTLLRKGLEGRRRRSKTAVELVEIPFLNEANSGTLQSPVFV